MEKIEENIFIVNRYISKNLVTPGPDVPYINPGSRYLLAILYKHGTCTMSDLSKSMNMPKPNVTPIVDRLCADHLVLRLPDEHDRRIVNVKLTQEGEALTRKIKESIRDQIKLKLSILSDDKKQKLTQSLQEVIDILSTIID